jgi:hypothetical protein
LGGAVLGGVSGPAAVPVDAAEEEGRTGEEATGEEATEEGAAGRLPLLRVLV